MTDRYVYVTGQDGEVYEVRPTDALLSFLQRLAEGERAEEDLNSDKQISITDDNVSNRAEAQAAC